MSNNVMYFLDQNLDTVELLEICYPNIGQTGYDVHYVVIIRCANQNA